MSVIIFLIASVYNASAASKLSASSSYKSLSSVPWSERLAERYRCCFSPVLVDWFDSDIWKRKGCGEYSSPVEPALLLSDAPEQVWPGLMSCDLIPLVESTAGDWLCVRVDENSMASEVVQWYHGGGDWIPWGQDIAQAIVFDGYLQRISSDSRRHAIPAAYHRGNGEQVDDLLVWALQQMPTGLAEALDAAQDSEQIANSLLNARVAEVAVHCELVLKSMSCPDVDSLRLAIGAEAEAIDRNQLTEWSFDTALIPDKYLSVLKSGHHGLNLGEQDWQTARVHADAVTKLAPNLAWGWEILGYCEDRADRMESALDAYSNAIQCSVFTDQSVRMNTHWATEEASKFSIERLRRIDQRIIDQSDYLSTLLKADGSERRACMTAYWKKKAAAHLEIGEIPTAVDCYMAAGWDLGAGPIQVYGDILTHIQETAETCGQSGRAEVAATHRRCLRERYGI